VKPGSICWLFGTTERIAETGSTGERILEKPTAGAKQAAEKLNFSERAKNRSRQNASGAIREGRLMVFYPPIFGLSPFLRSFSAACKARVDFAAFSARLKSCPDSLPQLGGVFSASGEAAP
jgi:hypothetical protein